MVGVSKSYGRALSVMDQLWMCLSLTEETKWGDALDSFISRSRLAPLSDVFAVWVYATAEGAFVFSDNAHKYDDQSGYRQDQFDGNVCMYYTTRHEDTKLLQSCLVAMVKEAATLKFLSDDIVSESKFGNK
ncbi:hypothetical protein Tco_1187594, partial [Tanacetum coccineum]